MALTCKPLTVLSVASILGLLVTACGTSKVAQCNKLIGIANKATTEIQTTNQTNSRDQAAQPDTKAAQLDKIADSLDQYAQEMQAVELLDEKLQGFRTRFVQLYQQTSKGSRDVSTAVKTKNFSAANQSLNQLRTGINQEKTLVNEVNQYCRGR